MQASDLQRPINDVLQEHPGLENVPGYQKFLES